MDRLGSYDEEAGRQARQAYERAEARAVERAHRAGLAEERRRQRAAVRAARAGHKEAASARASVSTVSSAGDATATGEQSQRVLDWWTVSAMLLAWFGSVPSTVEVYAERRGWGLWAAHLLVGMPTVVSLLALLWFLFTVPIPKPTVGRVVGALLLAPLFLVVGMLVFLFTLGLGSLVFAWWLRWQGGLASASAAEQ